MNRFTALWHNIVLYTRKRNNTNMVKHFELRYFCYRTNRKNEKHTNVPTWPFFLFFFFMNRQYTHCPESLLRVLEKER